MIERMTARAFRARFNSVKAPVLVGSGIWFPEATSALLAIAEAAGETENLFTATLKGKPIVKGIYPTGTARGQTDAVSTRTVTPSTAARPMPNLSKEAQVKGKMGR